MSLTLEYVQPTSAYTRGVSILPNTPFIMGGPATFSVVPDLPDGLRLDPDTGVISGIPTTVGSWRTYIVTALDGAGTFVSSTLTMRVYDVSMGGVYTIQQDETKSLDLAQDDTRILISIGSGSASNPSIFNTLILQSYSQNLAYRDGDVIYLHVLVGNLKVLATRMEDTGVISKSIQNYPYYILSAGENAILVCSGNGNWSILVGPASALNPGMVRIGAGLRLSIGEVALAPATPTRIGGVLVGSGLGVDANGTIYNPNPTPYVLPTATPFIRGGIRVGGGLEIDAQGILSAVVDTYQLPIATPTHLGGVKVGPGLTLDPVSGVLSANAAGVAIGPGLEMDREGVISTLREFDVMTPVTSPGVVHRILVRTVSYTYAEWWRLQPGFQVSSQNFSVVRIPEFATTAIHLFDIYPTNLNSTSEGIPSATPSPLITLNPNDILEIRQTSTGSITNLLISGLLKRCL